ncbi:hypothetical protein PGQ11_009096 [Apiospora arundinis]|uniref:Uncharacterized protein n=1 Tax=Apiospora arundinis TaxID=335852 RepID=A0ABR2IH18_9PEZI
MPYLRAEAPAGTPDEETIEYLLGQRHTTLDILPPIFDCVRNIKLVVSTSLEDIQKLFAKIESSDIRELAKKFSADSNVSVLRDNTQEIVVEFSMASKRVRLMQCLDLDITQKTPFEKTQRCKKSKDRMRDLFSESKMSTEVQQFMVARLIWENGGGLRGAEKGQQTEIDTHHKDFKKDLGNLRSEVQERFWLHSSPVGREGIRDHAWNGDDQINHIITVWELVDADVFVLVDAERRIVFANLEAAAQLLFGPDILRELNRAIDMFSFFAPIRAPEAKRHVVDRYIRRTYPDLDPSAATLDKLVNTKMGVAHYGYWSVPADPKGKCLFRSNDCFFGGTRINHLPRLVFPHLCDSVFTKATEIIRLLVKNLDPNHHERGKTICENIPRGEHIKTADDDFLSLFVLGINAYTQRHRDPSDVHGGFSGLFSFGQYTGIKVPYAPGACAIVRGDKMDHLVADYSGQRYFIIGTNHENVKRHARHHKRNLRPKGSPSPAQHQEGEEKEEESDSEDEYPVNFPLETPCVNDGADSDDSDDPAWTNWELHEACALDSSDSNSSYT